MSKNKLYTFILLSAIVTNTFAQTANADSVLGSVRADQIPAGQAGYNYIPGAAAANDSITPSTFSKGSKFGLQLSGSTNRACGELNPFVNFNNNLMNQVSDQIDKVKTVAQSLSSLISSSAIEYAIAKINPTLSNLFNKQIDEYIELFELQVKSCEEVQATLSQNPNASVFTKLFDIALAEQWQEAISKGSFDNSREFKKRLVEKAKKEGLPLADGKKYGGTESKAPINFNNSIAEAGINMLVGRESSSTWKRSFSSSEKKQNPIAKEFASAKELNDFLTGIYGSIDINIGAENETKGVNSRPGSGYQRAYSELRNDYIQKINDYMFNKISREEFERQTGLLIPPVILDDIANSEPYQRQTQLEQLAKEQAVDQMVKKLSMAANALDVGIMAPDLVKSKLYPEALKAYKHLYYKILDDKAELTQFKY